MSNLETRSWWLELAITTLVGINMAMTGWCLTQVVDIKTDLSAIKGNRFTSSDGLAVWREIASIRESLAKLPAEYPPKWWVERQDKFERDVQLRFDKLETRWEEHVRKP